MKPLVAKEILLLLPAFVLALLLSLAPLWLYNSIGYGEESLGLAFYLLCFGGLMIALSSFGREFALGTFPGLLALPLSRARVWWIKIAVLSCALATVFGTYYFVATHLLSLPGGRNDPFNGTGEPANFTVIATACLTIFASGLWTTLLLRQMMAAFWFALLVPATILTLILWNGGTALTAEMVLSLYSLGGFAWAWRRFYRAQEVAWTGGEITLPDWKSASTAKGAQGRSYRPLAAMVGKEIRLYRVVLLGMAGLFILHLGIILARKTTQGGPEFTVINTLLTMFGGVWLIVPFLTASLNVADERRLGTLEAQLCQPISTRKQFTVKLFVVLLLSGFLSALLLCVAEGIGSAIHSNSGLEGMKILLHGEGGRPFSSEGVPISSVLAIFLELSLLVFYASTLSRSILQTIVTAVAIGLALAFVSSVADEMRIFSGPQLRNEPLFTDIVWPTTMIAAIIWFSYRNYCRLSETRLLWLRNVRGLILVMLFAVTITTLIFNRTWELLMPLEPPHGPSKLNISESATFRSDNRGVSLILPDGRLWSERLMHQSAPRFFLWGDDLNFAYGDDHWIGQTGNHFLEGSNWVAFTDSFSEIMAIRSDGTLWASEKPDDPQFLKIGQWQFRPPSRMIQLGNDTHWKSVAGLGKNIILLKSDGTLWCGGQQLGFESDWSDVLSCSLGMFVWKSDGRAWKFNFHPKNDQGSQIVLNANMALERWETFDHIKWRSLAGNGLFALGVRDDGTLWRFGPPKLKSGFDPAPQKTLLQIGTEKDWISVAGANEILVGLKADGTLWKWNLEVWRYSFGNDSPLAKPPTLLGTHHDWVAISGNTSVTSLAADGSIWYWREDAYREWLAASRKPVKFDNIFAKP